MVIRRRIFFSKLDADTAQFDIDLTALNALGYDRLILKAGLRSSIAATSSPAYLYLDGDFTHSNYRYGHHYGGTGTSGGTASSPNIGWICGNTSPVSAFSEFEAEIQGASMTHNLKQVQVLVHHMRTNNAENYQGHFAYTHHTSTAAVTRLTLRTDNYPTGVFKAGSWVEVIGEKSDTLIVSASSTPTSTIDLTDIDATAMPADGDILQYNTTTGKYQPTPLVGTPVVKKVFREAELITEYIFGGAAPTTPVWTLPQTYDWIDIEIEGRSDGAVTHSRMGWIANGEIAATNYFWQYFYGSTSAAVQQSNARFAGYLMGATPAIDVTQHISMRLLDYTSSVKHKHARSENSHSGGTNYEAVGFSNLIWKNPTPITTLQFDVVEGGYNFVAGTRIRLWGVKNREVVVDGRAPDSIPTGPKQVATFAVEGNLALAARPFRIYNAWGTDKTIEKVFIAADTAPEGAAIIVDVNKNGSTIFTNQVNRPQIAASANTGETAVVDVPLLLPGDYLQVDIDQVGSTVAGANLLVQVVMS
jgi:hypothetical protein